MKRWLMGIVLLVVAMGLTGCTQYVREYHFIVHQDGYLEIGDIEFLLEYTKQDEAEQTNAPDISPTVDLGEVL